MTLPRRDHLTGRPVLEPQPSMAHKKAARTQAHRAAQPKATRSVTMIRQGARFEVDIPVVESRFLVNFREPSTDVPGLVQTDDGIVYLVLPDGTRQALSEGGGSGLPPQWTADDASGAVTGTAEGDTVLTLTGGVAGDGMALVVNYSSGLNGLLVGDDTSFFAQGRLGTVDSPTGGEAQVKGGDGAVNGGGGQVSIEGGGTAAGPGGAAAGGNVNVTAGDGSGDQEGNDGGDVNITAGERGSGGTDGRTTIYHARNNEKAIGTNTDGDGDAGIYGRRNSDASQGAYVIAGPADGDDIGGTLIMQGGQSTVDNGGDVYISGGYSQDDAAGNVDIIGGPGGVTPGRVRILHSNTDQIALGTNTDSDGDAGVYGRRDDGENGYGGSFIAYAYEQEQPDSGGPAYMQGGFSTLSNGGGANIQGGSSGNDNGNGGTVDIRAGSGGNVTGIGGNVDMRPGEGDTLGAILIRDSQGNEVIKISDVSQMGFFGENPKVQQTVDGALSTVADAPAKAVLTSIIAALTSYGLTIDGTT